LRTFAEHSKCAHTSVPMVFPFRPASWVRLALKRTTSFGRVTSSHHEHWALERILPEDCRRRIPTAVIELENHVAQGGKLAVTPTEIVDAVPVQTGEVRRQRKGPSLPERRVDE
jgi:hypothetical protein